MAVENDWTRQASWAIEFEGEVVGGIRLYITADAAKVAGLGYNLARSHWGQGITTEAARAVLAYAFDDAGLHKICSTADARNLASIRVMSKLGMTWEATLRQQRVHRGEYVDEVHYGLLAEKWRAKRPDTQEL